MRADSGATPQLSEAKEDAIDAFFGAVPYEVLNERMIIIEGVHTLVVDDIERLHLEQDVFFASLPQIGSELLYEYIPKDLDAGIMMKYVNLVIEDPEVDDYTTCRFIQQLIDWDRYLHDMLASVEDDKSAVSSQTVLSYDLPVEVPQSILPDILSAEEFPVMIELGGNQVSVNVSDDGTPTRTFHFIRMDVDPLSELQRRCAQWGVSGLFVAQTESNITLKGLTTGTEYTIETFELGANTLDELMIEIECQVNAMKEGYDHVFVVTRGIYHSPSEDDKGPEFEYTSKVGILATNEKVAPVQTKAAVTH